MSEFPPLPPYPSSSDLEEVAWRPEVYAAHYHLASIHASAVQVLAQEAELFRVQFHIDNLRNGLNLLEALEIHATEINLPLEWIVTATEVVIEVIQQLVEAKGAAQQRDDSNVAFVRPVHVPCTGSVGRPRKEIDEAFLREVASPSRKLKMGDVAKKIGVCRNTLKERFREAGVDYGYSDVSDEFLKEAARSYHRQKEGSGVRYFEGLVRGTLNLRVTQKRIRKCFKQANHIAKVLQKKQALRRRTYSVKRSNSLWHVDGHHKLILWGFVIHGIVDGHDHVITGIRCHTNNRAGTVLRLHRSAEADFGLNSRCRGDRGRENKALAVYMIATRGLNRGSFIFGPSTHNTRIERLWVEVGAHFARRWRAFFFRLERLHGLDRGNPHHLWILHRLFLDLINGDCKDFQMDWNHHPLSGEGHSQSPLDIRFMAQLTKGIYVPTVPEEFDEGDECANMTENEIQESYGAFGEELVHPLNHTGAGYLEDEEPDDLENLIWEDDGSEGDEDSENEEDGGWEELETSIDDNFVDAVDPPRAKNPFKGRSDLENLFYKCLNEGREKDVIPEGFGIRKEEWIDDEYPSFELMKTGRKGSKIIRVGLPDGIWRPRAEQWVRAISIVQHIIFFEENDLF